jgi:hypothetical protein
MKIRGNPNLRKLSIFMLATAAIVSMGAGAAKAQQYVNANFHNKSKNALIYSLRITRADNRWAPQGNFAGTVIYPGQYVTFQIDATTCMFYVEVAATPGGIAEANLDFCKFNWNVAYYGWTKNQTPHQSAQIPPTPHESCLIKCMYQGLMYEQHDTYGCNYACLLEYSK